MKKKTKKLTTKKAFELLVECKEKDTKVSAWEKIGQCGVDSGQIMLCDPCYIDGQ